MAKRTGKKQRKPRTLNLESLDSRAMMAADVASFDISSYCSQDASMVDSQSAAEIYTQSYTQSYPQGFDNSQLVMPIAEGEASAELESSFSAQIVAINGEDSGLRDKLLQAGDQVTFRLQSDTPVDGSHATTFRSSIPGLLELDSLDFQDTLTHESGSFSFGPNNTYRASLPTATVEESLGNFEIRLEDAPDDLVRPQNLELLVTLQVADSLQSDLSEFVSPLESTLEDSPLSDALSDFRLATPNLELIKGIFGSLQSGELAEDSLLDAEAEQDDSVSFSSPGQAETLSGVLSNENFETLRVRQDIQNLDAGDHIRIGVIARNVGHGSSSELVIRDSIPAGFAIPESGLNLAITNGNGSPIEFDAASGAEALFTVGITLQDVVSGVNSSEGENVVVLSYDLEVSSDAEFGLQSQSEAELLSVSAVEGGANLIDGIPVKDSIQVSLAMPEVSHSVEAAEDAEASARLTVGETATFRSQVQLPEGMGKSTQLRIELPRGLALQELIGLSVDESIQLSRTAEEILESARVEGLDDMAENQGRFILLDIGDVENSDRDHASAELIELQYSATVTNDAMNASGSMHFPLAAFIHESGSHVARPAQLEVVEPNLLVRRSTEAMAAQDGRRMKVALAIGHDSGSVTAHNVNFQEVVPAGWVLDPNTVGLSGVEGASFRVEGDVIFGAVSKLGLDQAAVLSFELERDFEVAEQPLAATNLNWDSMDESEVQVSPYNELTTPRESEKQHTEELELPKPEVSMQIVDSSLDATAEDRLSIGERATIEITIDLPKGQSLLELDLTAPFADEVLEIQSFEVSHIGSNLELEQQLGALSDLNADGNLMDRLQMDFGMATNTGLSEASEDSQIKLAVTAIVANETVNTQGDVANLHSEVRFGATLSEHSMPAFIVEPSLDFFIEPVSVVNAGEEVAVSMQLSHNTQLGHPAQNIRISGLPTDGLTIVPDSISTSAGEIVSGNSDDDLLFDYSLDGIQEGQSIEISMRLLVSRDIPPGTRLGFAGVTEYSSISGVGSRSYSDEFLWDSSVSSAGLRGSVIMDNNMDQRIGREDQGLADIRISLTGTDAFGNIIEDSTVTDEYGDYQFTGLPPGTYELFQPEQPMHFQDSVELTGEFGGVAEQDRIHSIVIPQGSNTVAPGYVFTESPATSVSGSVYDDSDANLARNDEEPGIAGVEILLRGEDGFGNLHNLATTTDADGNFIFESVMPGTYSVVETQPAGYADWVENVSHVGQSWINDQVDNIVVQTANPVEGIDFSEIAEGKLSGQISIDLDNDRELSDSDKLLQNVRVELVGSDVLGEPIHLETLTDESGGYEFAALRPGTYEIIFGEAEGLRVVESQVGALAEGSSGENVGNGIADEDRIQNITIQSGENWQGYDLRLEYETRIEGDFLSNYDNQAFLVGGQGDDHLNVVIGEDSAVISLNDQTFEVDRSDNVAVHVLGISGNDTASITGSNDFEEIQVGGAFANVNSSWIQVIVHGMDGISVESSAGDDIARLYDTSGDDHLVASPYIATWSGDGYSHEIAGIKRLYGYSRSRGNDTAELTGSELRDNVVAEPETLRMYDDNYYIKLEKFESVDVTANNAADRAYFIGGEDSDESLRAGQNQAVFTTPTTQVSVGDFRYVNARAGGGGADSAILEGSEGNDSLYSKVQSATYLVDRTTIVTDGFEDLQVSAGDGGLDIAAMYDSIADDTFTFNANSATVTNDSQTVQASNFQRIKAYSQSGDDVAQVAGGESANTFRGWADKWELENENFGLAGYGFSTVIASAQTVEDVAYLYDTTGDDHFSLLDSEAEMSGIDPATGLPFSNTVKQFNRVVGEAHMGGHDTASALIVAPPSTVRYDGQDLTVFGVDNAFSNNAIGFLDLVVTYEQLDRADRLELTGDLDVELVEDIAAEVHRLSLAPGSDGIDDSINDRVLVLKDET
ncbi:MAG: SdrD B-like domain-containing protein [Planctomycetota bacterium]